MSLGTRTTCSNCASKKGCLETLHLLDVLSSRNLTSFGCLPMMKPYILCMSFGLEALHPLDGLWPEDLHPLDVRDLESLHPLDVFSWIGKYHPFTTAVARCIGKWRTVPKGFGVKATHRGTVPIFNIYVWIRHIYIYIETLQLNLVVCLIISKCCFNYDSRFRIQFQFR